MKRIFAAIILILILSACQNTTISHKFMMKSGGWQKFENISFSDSVFSGDKPYRISTILEIDKRYPENDFVFQMIYESEDGESWNRAFTVEIKDEEGRFLQKETNGQMIYKKVLIPEKYFNRGKYDFEVVNLNPKLVTPGIISVEFVFEQ